MDRRKFLQMSGASILTLHNNSSLSSMISLSKNQSSGILDSSHEVKYIKDAIVKVFKDSLVYIQTDELKRLENYFSDGYIHPDDRFDHASSILYQLRQMCIYDDKKWEPLCKSYIDGKNNRNNVTLLQEFYKALPGIIKNLDTHGEALFSRYTTENDVRYHIDDDLLKEIGIDDVTTEYSWKKGTLSFFHHNSIDPFYVLSDSGFDELNLRDYVSIQYKNNIKSVQQQFFRSFIGFDVNNVRNSFLHLVVDDILQVKQMITNITEEPITDILIGNEDGDDQNVEDVLLLEDNNQNIESIV